MLARTLCFGALRVARVSSVASVSLTGSAEIQLRDKRPSGRAELAGGVLSRAGTQQLVLLGPHNEQYDVVWRQTLRLVGYQVP